MRAHAALARRDALVACSLWRQRGGVEVRAATPPKPFHSYKKIIKRVPKTRTKSGSQKKNQNLSPRSLLFENKLWTQTVSEQVPKMVTAFGHQNKNALLVEKELWTQTVSKQVPSMVAVFGPQNKNAFTTACVAELPRKSCHREADDPAAERRMHRRRRGATPRNGGICSFGVQKRVLKVGALFRERCRLQFRKRAIERQRTLHRRAIATARGSIVERSTFDRRPAENERHSNRV